MLARVRGAYTAPDPADLPAEFPNELTCAEQTLHGAPKNSRRKRGHISGYENSSALFFSFDINPVMNKFDDRRGHHLSLHLLVWRLVVHRLGLPQIPVVSLWMSTGLGFATGTDDG